MSIQNKKTVDAYQKLASQYLVNNVKHDSLDMQKAKRKKKKLQKFIKQSFSSIPEGSKILEIGSGNGENAKYLQELGYNVTASDIANDFIKAIRANGLESIKFNVLEDEFLEKYFGIFCWRVFVHFTKEDALKVLKKTYDALEKGGVFVFNAINRETRKVEEEWIDFPDEYHMGIDRYFNYYYQEDLNKLIAQTNYEVLSFHKEGGEDNNKWLVYV